VRRNRPQRIRGAMRQDKPGTEVCDDLIRLRWSTRTSATTVPEVCDDLITTAMGSSTRT
jgi:hypothetical protein